MRPQPGEIEWGSEEGLLLPGDRGWGAICQPSLISTPQLRVRQPRSLLPGPSTPGVLASNGVGTGLESLSLPPFTTGIGRGPGSFRVDLVLILLLALLVEKSGAPLHASEAEESRA